MRRTLTTGQPVRWPPSPTGYAQIDELRRNRVRLVYRAGTGRLRFPIIRAADVDTGDVLPFPNPLGRAAEGKSKTFEVSEQ